MTSPFSSDIPKPGSTEKLAQKVTQSVAMPVPAFGDLGKAANDVRRIGKMGKMEDVRLGHGR